MLTALLIMLREGFEAALVVAIVYALWVPESRSWLSCEFVTGVAGPR
jgi:high-affinity Fe2+/Pb2+ permease